MSVTAETTQIIPSGTWSIDRTNSSVGFAARHMGFVPIRGRFQDYDATVVGGAHPTVEGTIRVASLTTFDADRDTHLRAPDFLDADQYPEARFVSTAIEREGDQVVVQADLTLHGVSRPIELRGAVVATGQDPWGTERLGVDLEGSLDRTDFGVDWNMPLPGGGLLVSNRVQLQASLSFVNEG
jgi:polyisoprenoid-binding protein YceI